MYQIVIGDQGNTVSWLGRGKHGYSVHLTSASTPGILSSDQSKTFWLSWDRGAISLGTGSAVHEKKILKWRMDKTMKIEFIGFATTWGQPAEFRIWNFNDEAGYSQVIHLDIPHSLLPGSETGTLLVAGGLHLPYLADRVRPSLSEFSSLSTVVSTIASQLSSDLLSGKTTVGQSKINAISEIKTSLQNLMLYRRSDGSFSDHSAATSLWSTVEVLDLLSRAQSVVSIDTRVLTSAKKWVQSRQQADGSFKDTQIDVFPDNLTWIDEPTRTISTTASTLICLVNVGLENEKDSESVIKARQFLEKQAVSEAQLDSITLSALSYSLVKSRSDKVSVILDRLRNVSTNDEGEFGWPHQRENSDWLYEEGVEQKKQPILSHLREFKASLYTLMTYTALNDLKSAEPVARYLFYRSNLLDIHVELINLAVKAFSDFARLALDENRWLTVSLATSGMELTDTLELKASSQPQLLNLPSLPTKVFVYATGGGCATVQGRISYATYSTAKSSSHLDLWAGVMDEVMPKRNSIQELEGKLPLLWLRTCFRWKSSRSPGIMRVEIHLFSGFELVEVAPNPYSMDYGSFGDQIWFAVNNVSSDCVVCINFSTRSEFIINRLRPGLARAYPSGRPDLVTELFFHAHRGSPLLAGTSDDDLITWFGTTSSEDEKRGGATFTEACMCGSDCASSTSLPLPGPTSKADDGDKQPDEINDFTDIIVFSDLREDLSTTQAEFGRMDGLMEDFNGSSSHDKASDHNYSHHQADQSFSTVASVDVDHHDEVRGKTKRFHIKLTPGTSTFKKMPEHSSLSGHHEMSSNMSDASVTISSALENSKSHSTESPLRSFSHLSPEKQHQRDSTTVKPFFHIRTVEETVNTGLETSLKEIPANDFHAALLRPFESAKLAKVKTSRHISDILTDTRALGG
ncbi:hypothetical protein GE061_017300 [Apolygus lucorum]|uniref:Alpha-macroglobulin receptor-binding domain-containing protein n=1 Tax=Apolygus lucorum TaxID=248454 RepID=A0A8S9XEP5_APOLU|nr:hypothetical protein GE061_017300 [Apolygus lucorum]